MATLVPIIIEIGQCYVRAGFANEGAPRVVTPPVAEVFESVLADGDVLAQGVRILLDDLFVRSVSLRGMITGNCHEVCIFDSGGGAFQEARVFSSEATRHPRCHRALPFEAPRRDGQGVAERALGRSQRFCITCSIAARPNFAV